MARRKQEAAIRPTAAAPEPRVTPGAEAVAEAVPERAFRAMLAATLIVYAVVQLHYITATPLQTITLPDNLPRSGPQSLLVGIGPDEKEHFLYVLSLARRGALPAPDPARRRSPDEYVTYQVQHPPLFYALAALVYRAAAPLLGLPAIWYLLRGLCTVCGGVVIALAARAARTAFPRRPAIALALAPVVAFLPMFGHMTGTLSNEPLAMALGAWAWLQMVRMIRSEFPPAARDGALLGVTLGLAALTRLTALLWLPAAITALVFVWLRGDRRRIVPVGGAFAACFVLLLAPWLLRNQAVYGTPLLRTFDRPMLAYGSLADFFGPGIVPPNAPMVLTPLSTVLWYASTSWFPYWLVQFYLPGFPQAGPAWQGLTLILDVAVLLALFLNGSRARREGGAPDPAGRAVLWAAGSAVLFCVLVLLQQQFYSDWNVVNSAGRYTVAAVPASALLFVFAASASARSDRGRRALAGGLAAAMLAFDLYVVTLVRRFYADHPRQPDIQRVEAPRPH